MPKVSIASADKAVSGPPPMGVAGGAEHRALFGRDKDPIHLHLHRLEVGETLSIGPRAVDTSLYVWRGAIEAGGRRLDEGSSLVVERGASLAVEAIGDAAQLLDFASSHAPATPRAGGHVHLLPRDAVPRTDSPNGTAGGMHADATCPDCEVWLHENSFPGMDAMSPEHAANGVHSHEEDEVIFVTDGQIRLGARLYGPGTALAIAADTLYGFTAGPDGMRFVNFRAGRPREIHFASGAVMDEVAYWQERTGSPEYLAPV